jgi:hypothetical protein
LIENAAEIEMNEATVTRLAQLPIMR